MFCLLECYVHVVHILGTHGSHKTVSDPMELKLWIVVNPHMDIGNRTQVLVTSEPSLRPNTFILNVLYYYINSVH